MRKNTERLSKKVLGDLRQGWVDDEINQMSPDELFKNLLEYEGIINYSNWIKDSYESIFKKDEWCCYVLSREEVEKVMQYTFNEVSSDKEIQDIGLFESPEQREEFINDIVDEFKDRLHSSFDDWENELTNSTIQILENWKMRNHERRKETNSGV